MSDKMCHDVTNIRTSRVKNLHLSPVTNIDHRILSASVGGTNIASFYMGLFIHFTDTCLMEEQ
jgi:hypothetical protein